MKRIYRWTLVLVAVGLLVPFAGCNEPGEEEPTLEQILAIGKGYLITGDGVGAADAFHAALKIDPENSDALFGAMLANLMQFGDLVTELFNLIGSFMATGDVAPAGGVVPQGDQPPIGDLIQDFVSKVVVPNLASNIDYYTRLAQRPDFSFYLEGSYDLSAVGYSLASFAGTFGQPELHYFGAMSSLLLAVFEIVVAHDLNFDLTKLTLDFGDGDLMQTIDAIVSLLDTLLSDPNYPNFLYLDEDGVSQMQNAGIDLGMTFLRVVFALEAVRARGGDQTGYPIFFHDDNGNGAYDLGEAIELSGVGVIDSTLAAVIEQLSRDLAMAFFDTTRFDIDPLAPNPFYLGSLNDLLIYLGVLDAPLFDSWVPFNVGPFFASPAPDGLRSILVLLVNVWDLVSQFL